MATSPFGRPKAEGSDMSDPFFQREQLFAQDPKILAAVRNLATRVLACRVDPEFPERKPQALVVGGFVRDAMLGKRPADADIEVYGMSSERLEKFLDEMFPGKLNKVGKTFGIFSVSLGDGIELDISLPRRESKVGEGHKGFEVDGDPTMSVEEAARRRDFSFNGMAADVLSGEVIDPYGGLEDLKTKTLRVTDPERFQDDALRIYRGLQFAARMDLVAEPETLRLMREMVERGELTVLIDAKKTKELSKSEVGSRLLESRDLVPIAKGTIQRGLTSPRITDELKKLMLKAPRPSVGLDLARDLGILERYYPELSGADSRRVTDSVDGAAKLIRELPWLKDLPDKESGEAKMQIMLGSLVSSFSLPESDSSDPAVQTRRLGEGFFLRHEFNLDKIAKPAVSAAAECREPQRILSEFAAGALDEKRKDNEFRKLLRRIYPTKPEVLAAVAQVAEQGSGASAKIPFPAAEMLLDCARRHPEWLLAPNQLKLVSGDELMALGFKGRALGQMQARIEELRDEGVIETHEQAIEFLKNQAA